MDVCRGLEVAVGWSSANNLDTRRGSRAGNPRSHEDISAIRRMDETSDAVLRALVSRAPSDQLASVTVIVGLLPLAFARCRGGRAQVEDVVSELAIVIGEAAVAGL